MKYFKKDKTVIEGEKKYTLCCTKIITLIEALGIDSSNDGNTILFIASVILPCSGSMTEEGDVILDDIYLSFVCGWVKEFIAGSFSVENIP